jgi:hypothetical protein
MDLKGWTVLKGLTAIASKSADKRADSMIRPVRLSQ